MNIRDICARNVVVAEKDRPLHKAAMLMRRHHVGSVTVVSKEPGGDRLMGVFTVRDMVVSIIAEEIDVKSVTLSEAMSDHLITAHADDDVNEVLERMRVKRIHHRPVTDARGYLIGIFFTANDLLIFLSLKLSDLSLLIARNQNRHSS